MIGAILGTLHGPLLARLPQPRLESPAGLDSFGLAGALLLQLLFIVLIVLLLSRWTGQSPWAGLRSGLRPRQSAGQPSQNNAPYGGAAAVALLAIGLLLVTAEPWKELWGLAISGAHLAHFPGWDPQTSIFRSTWGLSMAPWPRPSAGAASGWRAADGPRAAGCWLLASGCNGNAILGGVMGFSLHG